MTDKVYLVYSTDGYESHCVGVYKTKKSAWKYVLNSNFNEAQRALDSRRLWGYPKGDKYDTYYRYYFSERELYD